MAEIMNGSDQNPETEKQMKGYRIAVAALAVVLVALSVLYFSIHSQQKSEYALLSSERDSIKENLTEILGEFDELETTNEELKLQMEVERNRTDSIITALKKERSLNYAKIRRYDNEVRTLRGLVSSYLAQIDSLNAVNKQLFDENVTVKQDLATSELRAEEAEKLAKELDAKVRAAAVLSANNISITSINKRGRTISRIKRATQISINFTVAANKLTAAGQTEMYARVVAPDGYVVAAESVPSITIKGEKVTYTASRAVDYQNTDLPVNIFFNGDDFVGGVYEVEIYNEGSLIGTTKLDVR